MRQPHEPYLPAREVIRFGLAVFARLGLGAVVGLVLAKVLKLAMGWPVDTALSYGYGSVAIVFVASFFLKPVAWPDVDYGPEPEQSLLDEGDLQP